MNYTKLNYQVALTKLTNFGTIKSKKLLQLAGDEEAVFNLSLKELSLKTGFSIESLKKMNREEALSKSMKIISDLTKYDINTVFYTNPNYPRRLKQCDDSPLLLYLKGEFNFNEAKYVAVVGTRDASEYGKNICTDLIKEFEGTDIVVISGMAYGIDITIHQLCIQYNVKTLGVMAHGLEIIYPQYHRETAKKMLEEGGLISEYPPGTKPDRENFPMRNRIVAGLCDATIVIESKLKGGSLITAELANDYSRDVFAYPGNVFNENSQGCNQLIASNKAHLISSGKDFLTKMGWSKTKKNFIQKTIFPKLSADEEEIVQLLEQTGKMNIDLIASELKVPLSKINVLLFQLEMNGLICLIPGNRCQLV